MKTITIKRSEAIYLMGFIAIATVTVIGQRIENDILIGKYNKLVKKHNDLVDNYRESADFAFDLMVDSCENTIFYSETLTDILDGVQSKTLNLSEEEFADLRRSLTKHKMNAFHNLRKLARVE